MADLRGREEPPGGPNSFNFHAVFWENCAKKSYVGAPPGSWRPLLGEILDPPLSTAGFCFLAFRLGELSVAPDLH